MAIVKIDENGTKGRIERFNKADNPERCKLYWIERRG
jgi:hypothetical protein